MELGFRIPIVSGIPDSLSCIPFSKAQDSGFHNSDFPDSGFRIPDSTSKNFPDSLTWGDLFDETESDLVLSM